MQILNKNNCITHLGTIERSLWFKGVYFECVIIQESKSYAFDLFWILASSQRLDTNTVNSCCLVYEEETN